MTRPLSHLLCLVLAGTSLVARAADPVEPPPTPDGNAASVTLDRVTVRAGGVTLEELPGSAHELEDADLQRFEHSDVSRVLRSVPGVYLQEEEGLGLRPNIGIRGSGTDRASRITLLEDGVLIAPAPYAAPAAYYFPTMRRMHGVEVVKGPASIAQGPRTVGGAINFLSTPIPGAAAGRAELLAGEDATLDLHAWYGASDERAGWLLETVQQSTDGFKHVDGGGDAGTRLEDYVAKFRLTGSLGDGLEQALQLKLGRTEQDSDETYLGLTDADFRADPYRRYAGSHRDNITTEHDQVVLSYALVATDGTWSFDAAAYHNGFARNWYKLDSVDGQSISNILRDPVTHAARYDWLRGAVDSPVDAFVVRNNNRSYYSRGLQLRFATDLRVGDVLHDLSFGLRLHEDEEDRFQDDDRYQMLGGRLVLTTDGAPGSQTNRVVGAEALAFHVQDRIGWDRWQVTPGLRVERIDLSQRSYALTDPTRAAGPTGVVAHEVTAVIPGVGVLYTVSDSLRWVFGVHEGFNPPAPGGTSGAEESLNLEFGARGRSGHVAWEAIAFSTDYSNLVGTCTASTGGGCTIGTQFDGGEATVRGLEFGADAVLGGEGGLAFPVGLAWTWTPTARFDNSFNSGFDQWLTVVAGDRIPYLPEQQWQLRAGVVASGWQLDATLTYVDEMRTVAGSGPVPPTERTDRSVIADLAFSRTLSDNTDLFVRVDNLFDAVDVVARAPAGVRPNKPRSLLAGIRVEL